MFFATDLPLYSMIPKLTQSGLANSEMVFTCKASKHIVELAVTRYHVLDVSIAFGQFFSLHVVDMCDALRHHASSAMQCQLYL